MVQVTKENGVYTLYGLSTDDKDDALEVIPSSSFRPLIFNEVNTGKRYYYDADSDSWVEWGTAPSSEAEA